MSNQIKSSDESWLSTLFFSITVSFLLLTSISFSEEENKNSPLSISSTSKEVEKEHIYEGNTLLASSSPIYKKPQTVAVKEESVEKKWVEITGYSSTECQTNSEPFITASGERVRDGIVAANFLEFGTEIRVPDIYGDKTFIVKDRMNRRYSPPYEDVWHDGYVDVWFETRAEARELGRKTTHIEIIK